MFDSFDSIAKRKKFALKFDVVVNSFISSPLIKEPYFGAVLKEGCIVYQETADFIVPVKRELRPEVKKKYGENGEANGLKMVQSEKGHHLKFVKL